MIPRKVISLTDKKKIIEHFKNDILDHDRYLRFGNARTDEHIETYIEISFNKFGLYNMWFIVEDKDKVIGTVHININDSKTAEMGFTVSKNYRGLGLGQNLFFRGATWAAMKGAKTIYTHCLSENRVMQHIAKKNGMTVITIDAGEREASITVTKNELQSFYEDSFLDSIAFVDLAVQKQKNTILSYMNLKK